MGKQLNPLVLRHVLVVLTEIKLKKAKSMCKLADTNKNSAHTNGRPRSPYAHN